MSTPVPSTLPGLRLDPASRVPVGEQIATRVTELVTSGALPTGHRLPAVR